MSVIYKQITTRTSLNDVYWFTVPITLEELAAPPAVMPPHFSIDTAKAITDRLYGCISTDTEDRITWTEVRTRQNELRTDEKDFLLNSIVKDYAGSGLFADNGITTLLDNHPDSINLLDFMCAEFNSVGPLYNPFTLTHTVVTVHDTIEHLVEAYNYLISSYRENGSNSLELHIASGQTYNNTYQEKVYDESGDQITFPVSGGGMSVSF